MGDHSLAKLNLGNLKTLEKEVGGHLSKVDLHEVKSK
jgi:hypothetical protein